MEWNAQTFGATFEPMETISMTSPHSRKPPRRRFRCFRMCRPSSLASCLRLDYCSEKHRRNSREWRVSWLCKWGSWRPISSRSRPTGCWAVGQLARLLRPVPMRRRTFGAIGGRLSLNREWRRSRRWPTRHSVGSTAIRQPATGGTDAQRFPCPVGADRGAIRRRRPLRRPLKRRRKAKPGTVTDEHFAVVG